MSPDNLGLFDTPPSRRQLGYSIGIVALLVVVLILLLIVPDVPLGQIDAFIPMIDTATILIDLITATLLFVQASVFRSRALGALATGYLFTGLMLIPHLLTFPGAFSPGGLLGAGVSTTVWIYIFWRTGLPVAIIFYVLFNRIDSSTPPLKEKLSSGVGVVVCATVVLVVGITILTTLGHDLLPVLYIDRATSNYGNLLLVNAAVVALALVAAAMLFRRRKSALDLWLLVVIAAWLIQTFLFLSLTGRFTVGWYFTAFVIMLSHLYMMLALIAELSRLYARLALSTSARRRERDARLISMDAVAAAIAHEMGQPLSAVKLNASAGLSWLGRPQPDIDMATKSLRAAMEAAQRCFSVIKSIRAVFAKGMGTPSEFSVNHLVRETVALLDRELAANMVSVRLALDERLPSIIGDRVQIQQVFVNLVMNAIEALGSTDARAQDIIISSAPIDRGDVLVEITDTGSGIDPQQMEQIFDTFFTTKKTGTGLGLALCRAIVTEHGGRLWASAGGGCGTTFHLQLPRSATHIT